jgi:putative transposase
VSQEFPTLSQRKLCAILGINRSTLWKQQNPVLKEKNGSERGGSEGGQVIELEAKKSEALRTEGEAQVVALMKEVVEERPTWGYRRVWAWLRYHHGLKINKKRVERLMRKHRWQVKARESTPRPRVSDSVSRTEVSDERWAIDMTSAYSQQDGGLGITAVIDCHDREIIGLCVSHRGRAQEAEQALEQACLARYGLVYPRGEERAQLRSDNGKVFTSKHFQACCKQYGLSQEFITPYTPQQNGMIERFFRSLKEECIWQHHFKTFEEAKAAIEAWVSFYNTKRPHQALGYLSPAQHRAAHTLLHVA